MGMEFRPYYFAREWQKMGHNVRIIGADFSHLRSRNPQVVKDLERQEIDGVQFQWIKTGTYKGNGAARALTMFTFCSKLWLHAGKLAREFKPDVVIASSTYPLDTCPVQKIAKLAKCNYIHEGHDLWPLTLTEIGGMSEKHPFVKLMAIAEKSAYSKANHVVSVLPNAVEHMLKHGLQNSEKFTWIPNGIVIEDWENPEPIPREHKQVFDKLRAERKFIVCYLGGHALSNALDTLVDAAALSKDDKSIAYVLIGKGVEKERLIKKAEGLDNIFFLPPVDKKQIPSALNEADVLYIGAVPSSLYRYGVSMNKVYDYMRAGKPIVYGVEAYNNDVDDFKCGVTIKPEDAEEIIGAVNGLKEMKESERKNMGSNGKKKALENYEYKELAKKFVSVIENANK